MSVPVLDGVLVVLAALGTRSLSGVAAALEHAGASVVVVSDLALARRRTALTGLSLTVVVDLPALSGSIHAALRVLSRQGALVLLSADLTTRERVEVLNSGADSVLASDDPGEVVAALAAVLRRSRMATTRQVSPIVCAGDIRVHLLERTATTAGRTLALTPLEFDLLAYFVVHAGEALTRDTLLEQVWGYDIGGRETVTVHVRRLREKIETDPSRPAMLQTVWGIGYRLGRATAGQVERPRSVRHLKGRDPGSTAGKQRQTPHRRPATDMTDNRLQGVGR